MFFEWQLQHICVVCPASLTLLHSGSHPCLLFRFSWRLCGVWRCWRLQGFCRLASARHVFNRAADLSKELLGCAACASLPLKLYSPSLLCAQRIISRCLYMFYAYIYIYTHVKRPALCCLYWNCHVCSTVHDCLCWICLGVRQNATRSRCGNRLQMLYGVLASTSTWWFGHRTQSTLNVVFPGESVFPLDKIQFMYNSFSLPKKN